MRPVCALGGYIRKLVVEIVCILECASATLSGERVFFIFWSFFMRVVIKSRVMSPSSPYGVGTGEAGIQEAEDQCQGDHEDSREALHTRVSQYVRQPWNIVSITAAISDTSGQ